jgi:hypothetical protein
LNLVLDLRGVACASVTLRGRIQHNILLQVNRTRPCGIDNRHASDTLVGSRVA